VARLEKCFSPFLFEVIFSEEDSQLHTEFHCSDL
jgi:hypothetical protein